MCRRFHERIHDVLPGIGEERMGVAAPLPVLSAPEPPPGGEPVGWIVCRDREEELVEVARAIKRDRPGSRTPGLDRIAVVFQRPLPYLYLARQVFADAQVPYQCADALPLAAEPSPRRSISSSRLRRGSDARLAGRAARLAGIGPSTASQSGREGARVGRGEFAAADALLRDINISADGIVSGPSRRKQTVRSRPPPRSRGGRRCDPSRADEARPALWRPPHLRCGPLRARRRVAEMIDAPSASAQFRRSSRSCPRTSVRAAPAAAWYARHLRARAAILPRSVVARRAPPPRRRACADGADGHDPPVIEGNVLAAHRYQWTDAPRRAPPPTQTSTSCGWWGWSKATGRSRPRSIFYPSSLLTRSGGRRTRSSLRGPRPFHDLLRLATTA